jgi:hypothetical protein
MCMLTGTITVLALAGSLLAQQPAFGAASVNV